MPKVVKGRKEIWQSEPEKPTKSSYEPITILLEHPDWLGELGGITR